MLNFSCKFRKLECLLADAISQECDVVMTCGGVQSNHCRATAVACRELGMKTYLFLRSDMEVNIDLSAELVKIW